MTTLQAGCARPLTALTLSTFFAALAVTGAHAHVTLAAADAAPNSRYRAVLQVPHGCDGEPTNSVRVQIPEGVIAVKPMPKAGWTLTTKRGPYAKSYENHGRKVTEGVREIIWSGGSLDDEHFDEFTFTAIVATDGGSAKTIYFPTVQQCAKGKAAWTEVPTAQRPSRDLTKPAPALRISASPTKAQAGHHHHDTASAAGADTFKIGDIAIEAPWTRATPGGAKVAGGYLKVTNNGPAADKLIGATTDVAGRVEFHEMAVSGGVMRMRPVSEGLEIRPGQSVELKPGGYHVMFMELKRQLKQGETIKATLQFEKAGKVDITFSVRAVGASAPHHHH